MQVAIIGGGASGVICALKIKEINADIKVSIYEKSNKLLKKVALSGNGHCNLGNLNLNEKMYHHEELILNLKEELKEYLDYFQKLGLFYYEDNEGRLYPKTMQALTLVELLSKELFYKHVKVNLESEVKEIKKVKDKYEINHELYDKVVIAIGSNAFLANDLDHYNLVKKLNLDLVNLKPGLVGFKVKNDLKKISGVRAKASCYLGNHKSKGEVMFKDDGVSGICIMDLSIFYHDEKTLTIDLLSDFQIKDLLEFKNNFLKRDKKLHLYNLLFGIIHSKILNLINNKYENKEIIKMSDEEIIAYLKEFKEFKLDIIKTYDYKSAQVNVGGVSLDELNDFELKKYPNIYLCGEVIDEAGICGGLNLAFSFASGIKVSKKVCEV